jgi:predicted ATPase
VIELAMSNPEAPEHALELFTRRAKRVQPQFSLPQHHQKVLEICRLVQGFPLGIELAAALTRAIPVPELAKALGQHLDVLEGALVTHERHYGIRAVFEHSWNLLNASEQRALARMMVFQGGATRTAASFVMEANLATLVALVDKSLIQASVDGRYRVHPLLTQYCNEKLEVNSLETQSAGSRHSEHYLGLLETLLPRLRGSEAQPALEQIEADIENIRSAWLQALNHQQWQGFDQLADLVLFFDRRGRAHEGLELFEKTIAVLQANPVNPRAEHTTRLANYLINAAWVNTPPLEIAPNKP